MTFEKGFGVRELGKPAPVTPETLFIIGSVSKPLTTLLMARLVDAGKLTWDTPITEVLPEFALADEATTAATTIRHTSSDAIATRWRPRFGGPDVAPILGWPDR